jgi:hypothetical protein
VNVLLVWNLGWARVAFCLAVALTAAALADPLMEGLANAGAFGPGTFTDGSNLDMLPALCVGSLAAVAFAIGIARRITRPRAIAPAWLQRAAGHAPLAPSQAMMTFALQIGVLFAMETGEQIVVAGHPLGGTIWLGGPIVVSLALQALFGVVTAMLFSRVLHWLAIRIALVLHFVRCIALASAQSPSAHVGLTFLVLHPYCERALRRLRGRAPPMVPHPI